MTRQQAIDFLITKPYKFGHLVGFDRLTELHNGWMIEMIRGRKDGTLQSHRGSYKTTCDSVAFAILIVLLPNKRILFMRKTDNDVKEIISQVKRILRSPQMAYFVQCIYGVNLVLTVDNAFEIKTNLTTDPKGTPQLLGMGIGGSLTGKHFDLIFTDDIVNVEDRVSKAERDRTKTVYQELQNVKNRSGRIFNTGTPWHPDDAFTLMPAPKVYDCYSTGLMTAQEIEEIRGKMTASLFAANYELRHIAAEDVIFTNPVTGADRALAEQGVAHIDAAYGGEDYTAFTICRKADGKYYVFGKLWRKHVDDCEPEILLLRESLNAGKIYVEDNGDKGYLAKQLRRQGERAVSYHETMNKFLKITTYLKAAWSDVVFVEGTDVEYIRQITDYNENAEHDDAPDSLASIIREVFQRRTTDKTYTPIW